MKEKNMCTKPMIKNKLLIKMTKFKVQTILVLDYKKKKKDRKTFHSKTKLIANNSDNYEAFKSMHQIIMTIMKNYACKDLSFL